MKKLIYSMMALVVSAFTFTSCEDVPEPYTTPTQGGGSSVVVEPTGDGTLANPFNVAGVVAYVKSLGSGVTSDKDVYVKGIVYTNSTTESTITQYGNMTFTMIDQGNTSTTFTAYQVYGPNKQKFTSVSQIQAGQEVIVCGKVVLYNGTTPETVSKGAAYVYSINGQGGGDTPTPGGDAKGTGTAADPYNVVAANSIAAALQKSSTSATYLSDECYVKGKVVSVTDTEISSYGNLTYYISDDGTTTNQLEVYRGFGIDGAKFTAITDLKAGDEVVICGKLQNWLGTYEFTSGSKLYSLNGKGGSGGGDTPTPTPTGGDAVTIDGTTVTMTNSAATAGTETATVDLNTLGYANGDAVSTVTLNDGTTITFDANGETNGPKFYTATKGVRVYKNNTITIAGKAAIASVVFTCDSYNGTDYVGNETATVSFSGKSAVYTNVFTGTSGGGTQLRVQTITITYAK